MSNVTRIRTSRRLARIPLQSRHYNAAHDGGRGSLADVVLQPQPTLKTDKSILRQRQHGNKGLPSSPLLNFSDEGQDSQRSKYKAEPIAEISSSFQQQLANNPFARALATPVRQCNFTQARLPTHFLLPTTTIVSGTPTEPDKAPRLTAQLRLGNRNQFAAEETLSLHSYVLNRQDMISHVSKKSRWQSLLSERQKKQMGKVTQRNWQSPKFVKDLWTWDENEGEKARELLEREVVEAVKHAMDGLEDPADTTATEFDLAFGIRIGYADIDSGEQALAQDTTSAFSLDAVLSPSQASELLEQIPALSGAGFVLPTGARTTKLHLALGRLSAFLDLPAS